MSPDPPSFSRLQCSALVKVSSTIIKAAPNNLNLLVRRLDTLRCMSSKLE